MRLSINFDLSEFASKDGAAFPESVTANLQILADQLQVLRDHLDKPIDIKSGYRSAEHNLKIGGALKSFHVTGQAADIAVPGVTPADIYAAIEELIKAGKMREGGLGLYASWVHYDTRGKRIRWGNKK
jgi:uncharacterized protein YcbK (DUF882 family)